MKKLIKPQKSVDNLTEGVIEAFCEYDGCSSNCRIDTILGCASVGDAESDEDLLF